eukprot:1179287-Pyramimonas_sp.AAC.1
MTVTSLRWGHVAHVALLVLRSLATLRVTVNAFESVANFKLCYGLYRPRNPWHARWLATCDCRADPRRPRNRVCAPAARTVSVKARGVAGLRIELGTAALLGIIAASLLLSPDQWLRMYGFGVIGCFDRKSPIAQSTTGHSRSESDK